MIIPIAAGYMWVMRINGIGPIGLLGAGMCVWDSQGRLPWPKPFKTFITGRFCNFRNWLGAHSNPNKYMSAVEPIYFIANL